MAKTIIFDRTIDKFIITSDTDYSVLTDIDLAIPIDGGVEIKIGGNTVYDNSSISVTNYNVDITNTPTNITTQVIEITLPKDSEGNISVGDYIINTFDRYTKTVGAGGGTEIYSGDSNVFTYEGQVDVSPCIDSAYSCVAPSITVVDSADYTFNEVSPIEESTTLTLTYPVTSGISPIIATTLPLQIDTNIVYTLGYTIAASLTLNYPMTGYNERIITLAEGGFSVKCDTLCSVLSCIDSFKAEMDSAKGCNDVKYQKLKADYDYIMSLATQVMMEDACDNKDKVPALLDEITNVINLADCKSNCSGTCGVSGVSEVVYGLGNAVSGSGLLNTNDGITFSPQTTEIVFDSAGLDFVSDGLGKVTVSAKVVPADVTSKTYIDDQDALHLPLTGGEVTGLLETNDINIDVNGTQRLLATYASSNDVYLGEANIRIGFPTGQIPFFIDLVDGEQPFQVAISGTQVNMLALNTPRMAQNFFATDIGLNGTLFTFNGSDWINSTNGDVA